MQPLQTIAQLQTLVRHKPIVVVEIGSIRCCACSAIAQKLSAHYKDDPLVACASLSLEAAADTCAALGIYSAPAVLVYVQGKLTIREAGVMSVEDIARRIARYREIVESDEAERSTQP